MSPDSHLSHGWGLNVTHRTEKGGKYWINGNYSAGLRVKLGGYESVKAQLLQKGPAAMMVMTQSAHMVVVFLLCHHVFPGCLDLNS